MALDKLVEEVKALTPDEQRELRSLLDTWLAIPPTDVEAAVERKLREIGMLRIKRLADHALADDFQPVKIEGKPLSETILEERR